MRVTCSLSTFHFKSSLGEEEKNDSFLQIPLVVDNTHCTKKQETQITKPLSRVNSTCLDLFTNTSFIQLSPLGKYIFLYIKKGLHT